MMLLRKLFPPASAQLLACCAILLLIVGPCLATDFRLAKIGAASTDLEAGVVTVQFDLSDGKAVKVVRSGPAFRPGRIVVVETKAGEEVSTHITQAEIDVLLPLLEVRLKQPLPDNLQTQPVRSVPEKLKADWWTYKSVQLLQQSLQSHKPIDPAATEKIEPSAVKPEPKEPAPAAPGAGK